MDIFGSLAPHRQKNLKSLLSFESRTWTSRFSASLENSEDLTVPGILPTISVLFASSLVSRLGLGNMQRLLVDSMGGLLLIPWPRVLALYFNKELQSWIVVKDFGPNLHSEVEERGPGRGRWLIQGHTGHLWWGWESTQIPILLGQCSCPHKRWDFLKRCACFTLKVISPHFSPLSLPRQMFTLQNWNLILSGSCLFYKVFTWLCFCPPWLPCGLAVAAAERMWLLQEKTLRQRDSPRWVLGKDM